MEVNKMRSLYYKEYMTMSEKRLLTSIIEVGTLRVMCTECDAVQEIPADSRKMPQQCFNCGNEIPGKILEAGGCILRALKLVRDVPESTIKLQVMTKLQEKYLHKEEK